MELKTFYTGIMLINQQLPFSDQFKQAKQLPVKFRFSFLNSRCITCIYDNIKSLTSVHTKVRTIYPWNIFSLNIFFSQMYLHQLEPALKASYCSKLCFLHEIIFSELLDALEERKASVNINMWWNWPLHAEVLQIYEHGQTLLLSFLLFSHFLSQLGCFQMLNWVIKFLV